MQKVLNHTLVILVVCFGHFLGFSQEKVLNGVTVNLQNDTLYIANTKVGFTYLWNSGNLILKGIQDLETLEQLNFPKNDLPNLVLPNEHAISENAKMHSFVQRTFKNEHPHQNIEISFSFGGLQVRHRIKVYLNTSAISHTYFLKGIAKSDSWSNSTPHNLEMIEKDKAQANTHLDYIGNIPFDGNHWKTTVVSFKEATDHHNNLVFEKQLIPYRKDEKYDGNVLLANNFQKNLGFFLLKEAPIAESQQYYNGFDFSINDQRVNITGIGIAPKDLKTDEWIQGYGYAIGIAKPERDELQKALLHYQKQLRSFIPERDGMILANTWGDRSKDSRMNEAFILKEIEMASKIGVTHLQLDDGWQQGLSRNSASKAGRKWDDWNASDWQPHFERFPNGFTKILAEAKRKNVEICLWFNPSKANSYALWERDADILIDYYKRYGIKVFKIDGISFAGKQSEVNVRKMFTKVMQTTDGRVTFNMDVTAGNRVGYHYFNEFGNIFLENRYTDWGNYYPHQTLRNLWMLSAYVPTERLQIEFLNNARNQDKYNGNDVLAPSNIPIDYTSALTLVAQPLAWMELSELRDYTALKEQFEVYSKIKTEFHASSVMPIGEEPSGKSWTGFVVYNNAQPLYILLFREHTTENVYNLYIKGLKPTSSVSRILGDEILVKRNKEDERRLRFETDAPFTYAVFSIE